MFNYKFIPLRLYYAPYTNLTKTVMESLLVDINATKYARTPHVANISEALFYEVRGFPTETAAVDNIIARFDSYPVLDPYWGMLPMTYDQQFTLQALSYSTRRLPNQIHMTLTLGREISCSGRFACRTSAAMRAIKALPRRAI